MLSNSLANEGSWTVTVQAKLSNYSGVTPVTKAFTLNVLNPCAGTTI